MTNVEAPRRDLPVIDQSTAPFWEAAQRGVLLIRRCGDCGLAHFYPRPFCPLCWSDEVTWEPASGRGTLYTYSVIYSNGLAPFRDRVPYVAAIVQFAEGPRMMSNVVDCDPSELTVDMPVEVIFRKETDEITLPYWRPVR